MRIMRTSRLRNQDGYGQPTQRRCHRGMSWHLLWGLALLLIPKSVTAVFSDGSFGYVAETNVSLLLKLALDIRDMRATDDLDQKKSIYVNGANALPLTLRDLSLNSSVYGKFPLYNVYTYAYYELGFNVEHDQEGYFDGNPVDHYADTLVTDLFLLNRTRIEADGALVFGVTMAYWGSLSLMLNACERQDDTSVMVSYLDQAVALWIGDSQERSDNSAGYMLYNLAEIAGTNFGQDNSQGESLANQNSLETFVSIKSAITSGDCNKDSGYRNVRQYVRNLVALTNKVLVQMLLHHIETTENSDFMELYTLALLPQIGACHPAAMDTLLDKAVANDLTEDSKPVIISAIENAYSCLLLQCKDVGAYQEYLIEQCNETVDSLSSYVTVNDVKDKAYIDRDIQQIRMFLRMHAYDAATDLYQYGWNTNFPLQALAKSQFAVPVTSTELENLKLYNDDDNFADNTILGALDGSAFQGASDDDRSQIVLGMLEGIVMFYAVTSELESAVLICQNSSAASDSPTESWDSGAAFFVGSMEGATEDLAQRGQLLYGLAKSLCSFFSTCESNNASGNVAILNSLKFGRNAISDSGCSQAQSIVQNKIKPLLLVSMIQATLFFASQLAAGAGSGNAGALYAFSSSILPFVNKVNATLASTIKSNSAFSSSLRPNLDQIFYSFADAIPLLEIDCTAVGVLTLNGWSRGVCPNNVAGSSSGMIDEAPSRSPIADPPTPEKGLAWGRYTFENDEVADNDSMFSLDVKAMATTTDVSAADSAYSQPSKYATQGLYGVEGMESLSSLSTEAQSVMKNDAIYSFFVAALFDDNDFENQVEDKVNLAYADTIIRLALDPNKGNSPSLAADATVVLSLFMVIVHRLYDSVRECKLQGDAVSYIDSAVALWIGREQAEGGYDSGWMMYAQVQKASQLYGVPEGEANVNTRLMDLFNEAQTEAKSCSSNGGDFRQLRLIVESIASMLSKSLLQRLLFHISESNRNYVELFALAFVPQAVACDQNAYEHLRDALFLDFDPTDAVTPDLISNLAKVLQCLRYECGDLGDTSVSSPSLKRLVSAICSAMDDYSLKQEIAGYETETDVTELARIDLDVLQIEIAMQTTAYDLASEIYTLGRNSLNGAGGPMSLQSLATDDSRTNAGSVYDEFQTYFQSDVYADEIIRRAINVTQDNGNVFETASRLQRKAVVVRTLQTMVPYMQVVARLRSAVSHCKASASGQQLVDEAAAIFTGSIEGKAGPSDSKGSGRLLYALGQEFCEAFNECTAFSDASQNEVVLASLGDMKRSITSGDCDSASTIADDVVTLLPIPMIQGTLLLAVTNSKMGARSRNESLGTAYVLASSVLPLVKQSNSTSAGTIINNMDFNLDVPPVNEGPESIFAAFRDALPGMGIDCQYVGSLEDPGLTTCSGQPETINVTTPTSLGGDLYVSTTNVQDRAAIALDIKSMQEALDVGRAGLATIIYREGENSPIFDDNGIRVDLRSLSKFSTDAYETMKENPLYQVAVYALRDADGLYLGANATEYADTIVMEALTSGAATKSPIGAEAAVALNLWMELVNELYETLERCKSQRIADDDGVRSIDEAAAYWIGDGQVEGNAEKGHLLYAFAELMGDKFGVTDETSGQAKVNVKILSLFHQAKLELSNPGACAEATTYRRLRHLVHQITTQMVIVNLQALVLYLKEKDRPRVRIYAHSIVPLLAGCSPSTFTFLSHRLLGEATNYTDAEVPAIVASIQSAYPCFGVVCADVGTISSDSTTSACQDPVVDLPLAGYTPGSDVRSLARLDIDILELDILMQMQAYSAAEDLYSYGSHAIATGSSSTVSELSLSGLATSTDRSSVPQMQNYVQYYGKDQDYADTMIRYEYLGANRHSPEQRRAIVVGLSQYMVLYMSVLASMQQAVSSCNAGKAESAGQEWDTAAAWLIGSMEGTSEVGSSEGRLWWALSKEFCDEFNTCSPNVAGSSDGNDRLTLKLFSGRGAITSLSCGELSKAADAVSALIIVPFVQASLSVSVQLTKIKDLDDQRILLAKGYFYSQTILPLINSVNPVAAEIIAARFDLTASKPDDKASAMKLVGAFRSALDSLNIPCQDVGSSSTVDVCAGTMSAASKAGISIGVLLGVALLLVVAYCLWKRRVKTIEQERLIFKDPKGELNHTSDLHPVGRSGYKRDDDGSSYYEEKKEEMAGPGECTESSHDDDDHEDSETADDSRIQVV